MGEFYFLPLPRAVSEEFKVSKGKFSKTMEKNAFEREEGEYINWEVLPSAKDMLGKIAVLVLVMPCLDQQRNTLPCEVGRERRAKEK